MSSKIRCFVSENGEWKIKKEKKPSNFFQENQNNSFKYRVYQTKSIYLQGRKSNPIESFSEQNQLSTSPFHISTVFSLESTQLSTPLGYSKFNYSSTHEKNNLKRYSSYENSVEQFVSKLDKLYKSKMILEVFNQLSTFNNKLIINREKQQQKVSNYTKNLKINPIQIIINVVNNSEKKILQQNLKYFFMKQKKKLGCDKLQQIINKIHQEIKLVGLHKIKRQNYQNNPKNYLENNQISTLNISKITEINQKNFMDCQIQDSFLQQYPKQQLRSLTPDTNNKCSELMTQLFLNVPKTKNERGKTNGEEVIISRSLFFKYSENHLKLRSFSTDQKNKIKNEEEKQELIKNVRWKLCQNITEDISMDKSPISQKWDAKITNIFEDVFKINKKKYELPSALKRAQHIPNQNQKNQLIQQQHRLEKEQKIQNIIFDDSMLVKKRESINLSEEKGSQSEGEIYSLLQLLKYGVFGYSISLIICYLILFV